MELKEIYEMERATCLADKSRVYMIERFLENRKLWNAETANFKLYPRERELCEKLHETKHLVVDKSRCVGTSSTCLAFVACELCLAKPENPLTIFIISPNGCMRREIMTKLKKFLSQFPLWLWGDSDSEDGYSIFKICCDKKIVLKNGSRVIASVPGAGIGCGIGGVNWLIFDEAALIENGSDVYLSVLPTTTTDAHITLISTPNEKDKLHYEICRQAKLKGTEKWNGYELFEMKWFQDPRYNKSLEWRKGDENIIDEIDSDGNTKYNPEKWDKLLADGYTPWSPWYDKMRMVLARNEKSDECEFSFC